MILVILLVSLSTDLDPHTWTLRPSLAFTIGMMLYFFLLGLIDFQKRKLKSSQETSLFLASLELVFFFIVFHFILGAHRLLTQIPYLGSFQSPIAIFSLALYLLGMMVATKT